MLVGDVVVDAIGGPDDIIEELDQARVDRGRSASTDRGNVCNHIHSNAAAMTK